MTTRRRTPSEEMTPDRRPLTQMQATRLAGLTGLNARELVGASVVDIGERFRWRLDPELLFFRRICGQVVKTDPVTGIEYPVPFATVHVYDTDCNFFGFFPGGWPWAWFFPFRCRREEIASVVTDACGRFCVFVPRWEIDWILRFRRERLCFPDIFVKPNLRDLLEDLLPRPPIVRPPKPEPDPPPPFLLKDSGITFQRVAQLVGRPTAERLGALESGATIGQNAGEMLHLLERKALSQPLPPPLPSEIKELQVGEGAEPRVARLEVASLYGREGLTTATSKVQTSLAAQLNIDLDVLREVDFQRFIGPFLRCIDILVPEWMPILDVPDITFEVTQDVDGDGDQEVIYSEGFFDVRWNAGFIPDVTLEASPIAVTGRVCDVPDVPCKDVPEIQFVGRMPVINPPAPAAPYHDAILGYARRVNRPHPSGNLVDPLPNPLAKTPYTRVLQIYGCNHRPGAAFYRLMYSYNGGAEAPFTGLTWPLYRVVGGALQSLWPTADANGWYPILPDSDGWFPGHLLLDWPTGQFPDGNYRITVQLANAAKAVLPPLSAAVSFRVDNSLPTAQFMDMAWRVAGAAAWNPLPLVCPMVMRPTVGGVPVAIEFRVSYVASAAHLRSAILTGGGCGGGGPTRLLAPNWSEPPGLDNPYEHWHMNTFDNSLSRTAVFSLAGSALPGCYTFALAVHSRAFNPSGGDGGQLSDWEYDPVYNWVYPQVNVAVVDA
ncbi:MAG: hypothetical protein HY532_08730 [Chloroflexi bacterium]|nr:hypothetical protein [Chloroflexota bacterium]